VGDWIARGIAVAGLCIAAASLCVSFLAARYARRQAQAIEDQTWFGQKPRFSLGVENPNSGSCRLALTYLDGPPLDRLRLELVEAEDSPVVGFGVGRVVGQVWDLGAVQVGHPATAAVVRRTNIGANQEPSFRHGRLSVRAICSKAGRPDQIVHLEIDFPPTISSQVF
jgi:hypothetical protein